MKNLFCMMILVIIVLTAFSGLGLAQEELKVVTKIKFFKARGSFQEEDFLAYAKSTKTTSFVKLKQVDEEGEFAVIEMMTVYKSASDTLKKSPGSLRKYLPVPKEEAARPVQTGYKLGLGGSVKILLGQHDWEDENFRPEGLVKVSLLAIDTKAKTAELTVEVVEKKQVR